MDEVEERLAGGGVGGAVRVGDTVRRPTGAWTPTVHALLTYLGEQGLDGVPEVFGIDERGREVLSYLPGDSVEAYDEWPDWAFGDELISQSMAWLARYHRIVSGFRPAEALPWRSGVRTLGPGEIVCHNDFAPYNVIVSHRPSGVALAGVIDWDVAGPGRPLDDLAFAAWNFIPLYDARYSAPECVRKLRLMSLSYGKKQGYVLSAADGQQSYHPELLPLEVTPEEILEAVVPRMESALARIRAGAAAGDEGLGNLIASGALDWNEQAIAFLRSRLPEIRACL